MSFSVNRGDHSNPWTVPGHQGLKGRGTGPTLEGERDKNLNKRAVTESKSLGSVPLPTLCAMALLGRRLQPSKVKTLTRGHTAAKQQSQIQIPVGLPANPVLPTPAGGVSGVIPVFPGPAPHAPAWAQHFSPRGLALRPLPTHTGPDDSAERPASQRTGDGTRESLL